MAPSEELTRLLGDLRPAELALRDWARTRLDAPMVREIASLDYGMRVDDHQWEIEELLAARRLPEELLWPPRQVLELSSHGRPADARGHVSRLFSCLVLVRANDMSRPPEMFHLASLLEHDAQGEATEHIDTLRSWFKVGDG